MRAYRFILQRSDIVTGTGIWAISSRNDILRVERRQEGSQPDSGTKDRTYQLLPHQRGCGAREMDPGPTIRLYVPRFVLCESQEAHHEDV